MAARELLLRQKLAEQIEKVLATSERVFSSQKLSNEWMDKMLKETQDLVGQLTIYKFLHELPENEDLQLAFLELKEEEEASPEAKKTDSYGEEILKEIDEFESTVAEDVHVVADSTPKKPEADPKPETKASEQKPFKEEAQEVKNGSQELSEPEEKNSDEIKTVVETLEKTLEDLSQLAEVKETVQPADELSAAEINDLIQNTEPSLAEKLSKKSIGKLANSIALNERFLYSNELFDGNMEAFKKALNELDHIASLEDAQRYIKVQLSQEFNWEQKGSVVETFTNLVERRFK